MKGRERPPGIRIQLAKNQFVQLTDCEGSLLAEIRWRPCGIMYLKAPETVRKAVVAENAPNLHAARLPRLRACLVDDVRNRRIVSQELTSDANSSMLMG